MEAEAMAKKQLRWLQILTAAVLVLLCLALVLSVSLLRTVRDVRELGAEIQTVVARADELTADLDAQELKESIRALERTAQAMEAIDWETLGTGMNSSLEQADRSLQALSEAMEKVDFEALQETITALQTVVEPLARFAARFS
ncbi:MAG: hypothetical protein IKQ69_06090 [Oscillospiraceae bacterium]|nr:hypothetical protein [Oscillospiraceae bacterium]